MIRYLNGCYVTGYRAYDRKTRKLISWALKKCKDCGRFISIKKTHNAQRCPDCHKEYERYKTVSELAKLNLEWHKKQRV